MQKLLVSTHRCKVNHSVASQSVILSPLLRASDKPLKPVTMACVKRPVDRREKRLESACGYTNQEAEKGAWYEKGQNAFDRSCESRMLLHTHITKTTLSRYLVIFFAAGHKSCGWMLCTLQRKRGCVGRCPARHRCAYQDETNHSFRQKRLLGHFILLLLVVMMPFFTFFRAFALRCGPVLKGKWEIQGVLDLLIYCEAGWLIWR